MHFYNIAKGNVKNSEECCIPRMSMNETRKVVERRKYSCSFR